ncbi:MAG: NYN domain-containing protein [Bifidobacteriaceae bacterium]|jgi:uncharacterized LabA/DUF88 family protein|nr:NYN domain-containing protein [Bifidobacteriaceae bacterium]
MRSQCSLYVDAGYLLASVATRLTGTSLRSGIRVDYDKLIAVLTSQAEATAGVPLLRVNWYDAAKNALPDPDQQRIGSLPRVKVRLGRVGFNGEQKGVDLRIGLDMVAQSRNGAVDFIFLVSGDDDLTEAVEEAQNHGVQVIVLAIPDRQGHPHGVSEHLQRASDGVELVKPEGLDKAVTRTPAVMSQHVIPRPGPRPGHPSTPRQSPALPALPTPKPGPGVTAPLIASALPLQRGAESALAYRSETGSKPTVAPEYAFEETQVREAIDSVVSGVVKSFMGSAAPEELAGALKDRRSIPREVDRALLLDLAHRLNDYDLSDGIRNRLRDRFWEVFEREIG